MFNTRRKADLPKVVADQSPAAANDAQPTPIVLAPIEWPLECETMAVCHTALKALDPAARRRCITWLAAAFEETADE